MKTPVLRGMQVAGRAGVDTVLQDKTGASLMEGVIGAEQTAGDRQACRPKKRESAGRLKRPGSGKPRPAIKYSVGIAFYAVSEALPGFLFSFFQIFEGP